MHLAATTSLRARLLSALTLLLCGAVLGVGVAGAAQEGLYVVKRGDFLGRIAQRCGTTLKQLRSDNHLTGDVITPGQQLRVTNPFSRTRAADIFWQRPFLGDKGRLLRTFGMHVADRVATHRTGTDMACHLGAVVVAPAHGLVRYLGVQEGYGTLVIIDHGGGYATVLGPLDPDRLDTAVGRIVLQGDTLGRIGLPAEGNEPYLHLELRRGNEAVDPSRLLR